MIDISAKCEKLRVIVQNINGVARNDRGQVNRGAHVDTAKQPARIRRDRPNLSTTASNQQAITRPHQTGPVYWPFPVFFILETLKLSYPADTAVSPVPNGGRA